MQNKKNEKPSLEKSKNIFKSLCGANKRRFDKINTRKTVFQHQLTEFLMSRKHAAKPLGLTDDLSFFGFM